MTLSGVYTTLRFCFAFFRHFERREVTLIDFRWAARSNPKTFAEDRNPPIRDGQIGSLNCGCSGEFVVMTHEREKDTGGESA
jgi:hypothetical protein